MGIKEFLLENRGIGQTIFKNTLWLAMGEGVSQFLRLLLMIYAARTLGAEEFGSLSFAIAFVSLFPVLSDMGLSTIMTRELAKGGGKESAYPVIFSLKILLATISFSSIFILSFFITGEEEIRLMIWVLGGFICANNFPEIVFALFRAREKMEYESLGKIARSLLSTGLGFWVLLFAPSAKGLSCSYLIAELAGLSIILLILVRRFRRVVLRWDTRISLEFLRLSYPLALSALFISIYIHSDQVMMGYWKQVKETGWYNAAFKPVNALFILMTLIAQSFYPALSRFYGRSEEDAQRVWDYQMQVMLFISLPVMAGGLLLSERLLLFLFGPEYLPASSAFSILIIMAGVTLIRDPFFRALIVANRQNSIFSVTATGALLNVLLNLLLIPKYSLNGAAFASLSSNGVTFFIFIYQTLRYTSIKVLTARVRSSLLLSGVSTVIMSLFLWKLGEKGISLPLKILSSFALFSICYFGLIMIGRYKGIRWRRRP